MPQPFQPSEKPTVASSDFRIADKLVVFVANIEYTPPALDRALAETLVDHLHALDVPASTVSANRRSYMLTGQAQRDTSGKVHLVWHLIDAEGALVETIDQDTGTDATTWWLDDPRLAEPLAERLAPRLAELLATHDNPNRAARSTPGMLRPVYVATVVGAPGDGDRSLAEALRQALGRARITISDKPAEFGFSVLGTVVRTERGEGEEIAISWRVVDSDGKEMGVVSQSNVVPTGSLDGRWGAVARLVAEGGAQGVLEILAGIGRPLP